MHHQRVALILAPFVIICAVVAVAILAQVIRPKPRRPPRRDKTGPPGDEPPPLRLLAHHDA